MCGEAAVSVVRRGGLSHTSVTVVPMSVPHSFADPYIIARVGKRECFKSTVVPSTLNPVWGETGAVFTFAEGAQPLCWACHPS